ncbi:MAG TPA: hypothetical protein VM095_19655 [Pyrinomonadaceae bacterium]|nr:hypothetical protein [Pyrinomonadaceae bacterium]
MILKDKIIPVALVAALLGGSVGAIVSHKNTDADTASNNYSTAPATGLFDRQAARQISDVAETDNSRQDDLVAAKTENVDDPSSYRAGFLDGFAAARERTARAVTTSTVVPANRVVYRNVPVQGRSYSRASNSYSRASNSRQVYYDYNTQPRKRTFWQKHRDKLTVAMGAGGGSLLGALIGGKKGAAIGALAGGGGAAVYTYGIRKRNRRY